MTNDEICQHGDQSETHDGTHIWTSNNIDTISEHVVEKFKTIYLILLRSIVLDDQLSSAVRKLHASLIENWLIQISAAIMHRIQEHQEQQERLSSSDTHSESHIQPTFMAQCQALLKSIDEEILRKTRPIIKLLLFLKAPILVATEQELARNVDGHIFLVGLESFFSSAILLLNEKSEEQLEFKLFDNDQTVLALSRGIEDLRKSLLDMAGASQSHSDYGTVLNQISRSLNKMITYALVSRYQSIFVICHSGQAYF